MDRMELVVKNGTYIIIGTEEISTSEMRKIRHLGRIFGHTKYGQEGYFSKHGFHAQVRSSRTKYQKLWPTLPSFIFLFVSFLHFVFLSFVFLTLCLSVFSSFCLFCLSTVHPLYLCAFLSLSFFILIHLRS